MIDDRIEGIVPDRKMKEFSKQQISRLCSVYIIVGCVVIASYILKNVLTECPDWSAMTDVLSYFKEPVSSAVIVYLCKSAFENYNKYKGGNKQ